MLRLIPLTLLILLGCARNNQPVSGSATDAEPVGSADAGEARRADVAAKARGTLTLPDAAAEPGAPDGAIDPAWRGLHLMLRARHPEDLPTSEELRQIPAANEGLRHLAEQAPMMGTRARAVELLGHVAEQPDLAFLQAQLGGTGDAGLVAAAARGLAHAGLDRAGSDAVNALAELMKHGDPRVAIAAIDALSSAQSGRVLIEAADFSDPAYCPAVRERASAQSAR